MVVPVEAPAQGLNKRNWGEGGGRSKVSATHRQGVPWQLLHATAKSLLGLPTRLQVCGHPSFPLPCHVTAHLLAHNPEWRTFRPLIPNNNRCKRIWDQNAQEMERRGASWLAATPPQPPVPRPPPRGDSVQGSGDGGAPLPSPPRRVPPGVIAAAVPVSISAAQRPNRGSGRRPNSQVGVSRPGRSGRPPPSTCAPGTTAGEAGARPRRPRPRARSARPPRASSCPRPRRRAPSPAAGVAVREAEAGRARRAGRGRGGAAPGRRARGAPSLRTRGSRTPADSAGRRAPSETAAGTARPRREPGVPAPEPDGRPGGMRRWRGGRPAEPPRLPRAARRC